MQQDHLASAPERDVDPPEAIARLSQGRPLTTVWRNELGGLTFFDAEERCYLKWTAAGTPEIDLADEGVRLNWAAAQGAAVPRVLRAGADATGSWLVTAAIDSESAVAPKWIARPEIAARTIGLGLRKLHERLDPATCPFDWSVDRRLRRAAERRERGLWDAEWTPEKWGETHRGISPDRAWALLQDPPALDRPVVCHGDACAPNTLLDAAGGFAAHVDLGSLGVADRWADLAVAAWSTEWNYGTGYERFVYEGYGIEADPSRIAYYRMLWDLS